MVWMLMTIHDPESICTARSQNKVMPSNGIFYHSEHHIASVRIKRMAFCEINGFCVINGTARG